MREGWEFKCFEDCIIKAPKLKQVQTSQYNSGTMYPIVSQEEKLISGFCDDETMVYHLDSPIVAFGDHTRVLKYIDFDFVVGADGVKILIPKENVDAKFFYYYLLWCKIPSLGYSRHYKLLKEIKVAVPQKSTQLDIVAELDQINDLIRLKKEQLKEYDNLAQSIFYDMFGDPVENEKGWEVKKLKDISKVKIGPFGSLLHVEDYVEGGRPVVNPVHMNGGRIVADKNFSVSEEKYKELSSYVLKENDIVFGRRGDIGRCALVSKDEDGFICGTGSLYVRFDIVVNTMYILKMLLTNSIKSILISKAKGATMLNINCGIVENLQIPLPPLSLQQEFSSRIEQIEKLKTEVQKTITDLETLLASRMQYWFE